MSQFPQHGTFSISVSNNIVIASVEDSWNEETALAYSRAFISASKALSDKPWGHIVCFENWNLGAAEISPIIQELVNWCTENNLIRAAHVYSPSMVKKYFIDTMIVNKSGFFSSKAFTNQEDGLAWLAEVGLIP